MSYSLFLLITLMVLRFDKSISFSFFIQSVSMNILLDNLYVTINFNASTPNKPHAPDIPIIARVDVRYSDRINPEHKPAMPEIKTSIIYSYLPERFESSYIRLHKAHAKEKAKQQITRTKLNII